MTWASAVGEAGELWPPWIFIHGTDIITKGLIVLFFGLFSVAPLPPEIFLPTPLLINTYLYLLSLTINQPEEVNKKAL